MAMTKEERREYDRKYRLENAEKIKTHNTKYRAKNAENIKTSNAKATSSLASHYVKRILVSQGFKNEQITPELIELKRITLKTSRLCRQLKN